MLCGHAQDTNIKSGQSNLLLKVARLSNQLENLHESLHLCILGRCVLVESPNILGFST